MTGLTVLFVVYGVAFALVFLFVVQTMNRLARVEKELERLQQRNGGTSQ